MHHLTAWIERIPLRVRQTGLALSWFILAAVCLGIIAWSFYIAGTKHFLWQPQPGQIIPVRTRVLVGGLIPFLDALLTFATGFCICLGCLTWQRRSQGMPQPPSG
jgi:hypothetical protein